MEKIFVIYSRKSRFTGKGESIENQAEMCRAYLRAAYGAAAGDQAAVYEDEGFSGGNLDRPQFRKMMADARKQGFRAVVVYRLDRISRNIGDFAGLIQELGELQIGFISIREQFDTDSPMGRAMMYIASVFSQLERETIAQRIRDNMRELAKTGRWLGGNTPLGFCSRQLTAGTREGRTRRYCVLTPVSEETELVRQIFETFLREGTLSGTEACLAEKRTRQGKPFTRFALRDILRNPVYMAGDGDAYEYLSRSGAALYSPREEFDGSRGIMAYNRTRECPGKTNTPNPMDQWIVALGAHPGLIAGKNWIRVQTLLGGGRHPVKRRTCPALMGGLLFCDACGDSLRPKLTGRETEEGAPIYVYRCRTKEETRGGQCTQINLPGNQADSMAAAALEALPWDRAFLLRNLKKALEKLPPSPRSPEALQLSETCLESPLSLLDPAQRPKALSRLLLRATWDGTTLHLYCGACENSK